MNLLPIELSNTITLYCDHRSKLALKCCNKYYDHLICNVSVSGMKRRLVRAVKNNNMSMFTYCTGKPRYHTLNQIGFTSNAVAYQEWVSGNLQ